MVNLLKAMARQEGFYVIGSVAQRNHNPGNIEFGSFALRHGATGSDGRFAFFPDDPTGFGAMRDLLQRDYADLTIEQALNKWAPPVENDTSGYIENVCQWTGLKPGTLVSQALTDVPL